MSRVWVTKCSECPLWVSGDHDDDGDRYCDHPKTPKDKRDIELNALLQDRVAFPRWCDLQTSPVQLLIASRRTTRFWVPECPECPLSVESETEDKRTCSHPNLHMDYRGLNLDKETNAKYKFPTFCPMYNQPVQIFIPSQLRFKRRAPRQQRRVPANGNGTAQKSEDMKRTRSSKSEGSRVAASPLPVRDDT